MTTYESLETKIQALRDTAIRCMRAISRKSNDAQGDRLLDSAILWYKKADELSWKLKHMTIGEAEKYV